MLSFLPISAAFKSLALFSSSATPLIFFRARSAPLLANLSVFDLLSVFAFFPFAVLVALLFTFSLVFVSLLQPIASNIEKATTVPILNFLLIIVSLLGVILAANGKLREFNQQGLLRDMRRELSCFPKILCCYLFIGNNAVQSAKPVSIGKCERVVFFLLGSHFSFY